MRIKTDLRFVFMIILLFICSLGVFSCDTEGDGSGGASTRDTTAATTTDTPPSADSGGSVRDTTLTN